jgi:hypothetical protein
VPLAGRDTGHRQGAIAARHHAPERDPIRRDGPTALAVTEWEIEMNRGGGVGIIGVIVIVVVILILVGVIRL